MIIEVDDKDILDQGFTEDTLKSFLNIGYQLYKHQVLKQINTLVDDNLENVIQGRMREKEREYMERVSTLQNENLDLVKKMVSHRQEGEDEAAKKYILEIEKRNLVIEHLKEVLDGAKEANSALEDKIKGLYENIYTDSVQQLKDAIKQRDMEISILKGSNIVKGQIGENIIVSSLKSIFTDAEVQNTGKTAHVCDVHMSFKNGKKLVFESKYKGNIEKKDVDKFYRDMEGFDDEVIGGVFVSFLCKNIPNKGSINFEVTSESKKPLMYVAYESEDEFNQFFPHHVVMFSKLCDSHNDSKSSDVNISDVVEEVRFISEIVNKNKRRLDDFRGKFLKYYTEVEDDNKVLMLKIDNICKRVPKATNKKVFICNQCSYTCSTKKTLDKHTCDKHP